MIHRQNEIEAWGETRGMYEQSSAEAQTKKFWEEFTETLVATLFQPMQQIDVIDGIGDMLVVLVHISRFWGVSLDSELAIPADDAASRDPTTTIHRIANLMGGGYVQVNLRSYYLNTAVRQMATLAVIHGTTLEACIDHVIPIINSRTGRFVDGVFVKDKDIANAV